MKLGYTRVLLLTVLVSLTAAACGSSVTAPPVGDTELACAESFCVTYPVGWLLVDEGDSFLSFVHPDAVEDALATVGTVNMEGLVKANGGTWPALVGDVVEVFWSSIDDGNAELGRIDYRDDASVESSGVFRSGRLWHVLTPTDSVRAIGIEVRGPNQSWEPHARVFMDGLQVVP